EGHWYSLRVRPYRTLDNRIDGAVLVLVDIDTQKRAVAGLKESDRRKDEFLAMLAHELRNPLAPLKTSVDVLKVAKSDAAALDSSRHVMERQLQIMTRLVDDLLDASRISQNKIKLEKTPLDFRTVTHAAIASAEHLLDARRHKLSIMLPKDCVVVEGDAVRLEQVVFNLLSNAAKFTDPGGRVEL